MLGCTCLSVGSAFLQVFRYSTTLEKHKLFLSGLPFSCTKEELEALVRDKGGQQ